MAEAMEVAGGLRRRRKRCAPQRGLGLSGTQPKMLQENIPKWCVDFFVVWWVATRAGGCGGGGRGAEGAVRDDGVSATARESRAPQRG